jgi:uncharacterized membrane protein (UPF0127 family)
MTNLAVSNTTRVRTLATKTHLARSYWQRLIGLMGRKTLAQGEGLIIDPCSSVHTHFMRFAIDVIYVNKDHFVVGIDPALAPWKIGHFYKKVRYVVELPSGTAAATGTQVGDVLNLREVSS